MRSRLLFTFLVLFGLNAWSQTDCGCTFNENDTFICAQDSTGFYFPVPNACFAECWGLTVVDQELCDSWFNPWADCDCSIDENEPFICAQDSSGYAYQVPNACIAACLGLTVVGDEACDNFPGDCDCEIDPNEPTICAQDSFGYFYEVPNACFAACWGLTVADSSACEYNGGGDPWGDCDCEIDPAQPFICAQDSLGITYQVPNECFAACWGLTVVDSTECNNWNDPWEECGCDIDYDAPFICVQDSSGFYFQVPNECVALCFGFTVVEDSLCGNIVIDDPWSACDCEVDPNEPFLCAVDSLGHPCYVPNACFAACLNLTIVGDSICENIQYDDFGNEFFDCIDSLGEFSTFQQFILAANANCGLEVPQCILDAPTFDNDSLFFEYILNNCDDVTAGGNVINMFNSFIENAGVLATKDKAGETFELKLYQNPVQNTLNFAINTTVNGKVNITVTDISGMVKMQQVSNLVTGNNPLQIEVGSLNTGMYLLSIKDQHIVRTLKFVKE